MDAGPAICRELGRQSRHGPLRQRPQTLPKRDISIGLLHRGTDRIRCWRADGARAWSIRLWRRLRCPFSDPQLRRRTDFDRPRGGGRPEPWSGYTDLFPFHCGVRHQDTRFRVGWPVEWPVGAHEPVFECRLLGLRSCERTRSATWRRMLGALVQLHGLVPFHYGGRHQDTHFHAGWPVLWVPHGSVFEYRLSSGLPEAVSGRHTECIHTVTNAPRHRARRLGTLVDKGSRGS